MENEKTNREIILEKALKRAVKDINKYLDKFTNGVYIPCHVQEYIALAEQEENGVDIPYGIKGYIELAKEEENNDNSKSR